MLKCFLNINIEIISSIRLNLCFKINLLASNSFLLLFEIIASSVVFLFVIGSWIPNCAQVFLDKKDLWYHLVPQNDVDSLELVKQFFASVGSLMSIQLRNLVINSLKDFLKFLEIHIVSTNL